MKAKSSYQRITEKYHHAVIELGLKDKRIKELEKQLDNKEPKDQPEPSDPYRVFRDAQKKGKTVQFNSKTFGWVDCRNDLFNNPIGKLNSPESFRIKPEPEPKPNPIPFTFKDADLLINQTIKNKASGELLVITRVRKDTVVAGDIEIRYDHLFKYYDFKNGSVCGKESNDKPE